MANIDTIKTRYGIVGHNPKLNSAIEIAIQVAPTEVTVLIQGENGTGKDVFSRIIHQNSRRKHEPFMAINTGAIPEGTMDSELFGHEKGSFTGAVDSRKGYFEEVDGGTLFLDEIAEMPMATQARLLRLLENKEYLRVGSSKIRNADVRVVAASNKNLFDQIRKGKFREDLFFRLNTVTIQVPPLRERGRDIELLFQYFADEFAHQYKRMPLSLSSDAADILYQYRWPGNVRELRNFVEKLTVLVEEDLVTSETISKHLNIRESYLPSLVGSPAPASGPTMDNRREIEMLSKMVLHLREEMNEMKEAFVALASGNRSFKNLASHFSDESDPSKNIFLVDNDEYSIAGPLKSEHQDVQVIEESLSLEKKEKELIIKSLAKHNNVRKKAAKELGISERTLYRKLKNYDLV